MTSLTDQEVLESNLISSLHLESLADDHKIQLLNNIATLVQKRAMLEIIATLSEAQQAELDTIVTASGAESEAVAEFLKNNVSNMEEIVTRELVAVKRELMEKAGELEERIGQVAEGEEA